MATLARLREVFDQVADLEGDARERALERACAGDVELLAQVRRMLEAQPGSFLEKPAAKIGAGELRELMAMEAPGSIEGKRFGPYQVRELLGSGGMGVVYLAEQDKPRRRVALKLMRSPLLTPSMVRRFEHEAEVLGRLKHPGIAQVYEAGSVPGADGMPTPYFAMELVRGRSLLDYAADLGVRARLELFAKICDAVQHAHQMGVVHRDLKPANILVEEHEDSGATRASGVIEVQPKVLDFGVARVSDPEQVMTTMQTDVGQVVGTLPYMSPEQVRGRPDEVDVRSDTYALGIVLYQLLVGRLPYEVKGLGLAEAAGVITTQEPRAPSAVVPALRGDVETILLKALSKEPERRYQSASDLAADVRRYLADLPIVARPATASYYFRKFARRNRVLVGGVAAALVLLVAGVVGTSVGLVQSKRSERRALEAAAKAEKTSTYLLNTIGWFKPGRTQSPTVGLKDVLDSVASRIDKELGDQPEAASLLHRTVAENYLSLSAYDQAQAEAERAQTLGEGLGARGTELVSRALEVKAAAYRGRGDYASAVPIARRILEIAQAHFPPDPLSVAKARTILGASLRGMKAGTEAQEQLTLALDTFHATGGDRVTQLEAANELAMILRRADSTRAVALMREAIDIARTQPEVDDEQHAILANNLATALKDAGDYGEAERLYKESLDLRIKIYGEEHAAVALAINNLGTVQLRMGEMDAAEASFTKALAMRRRLLGPEHRMTLNTLENLTRLDVARRNNAAAEAGFREVLRIRTKIDGPDHPDTGVVACELAGIITSQGRLDEADKMLADALPRVEAALGEDKVETWLSRTRLAQLRVAQHRAEEGEKIFRSTVAWYDKHTPGRWIDLCTSRQGLASALYSLDRFEEAAKVARESLDILQKNGAGETFDAAVSRVLLAKILVQMVSSDAGKAQEARDVLAPALALYRGDPRVSPAQLAYAEATDALALEGLQRHDEAEAAFLGAMERIKGLGGAEGGARPPEWAQIRDRFARFYESRGREADAARVRAMP